MAGSISEADGANSKGGRFCAARLSGSSAPSFRSKQRNPHLSLQGWRGWVKEFPSGSSGPRYFSRALAFTCHYAQVCAARHAERYGCTVQPPRACTACTRAFFFSAVDGWFDIRSRRCQLKRRAFLCCPPTAPDSHHPSAMPPIATAAGACD